MEKFNKDEEIARLLENLPTEQLELAVEVPTRSKFYTLEDPDAPITVRAMKYEDERAVADARRKGVDAVNILLERCMNNIEVGKLYIIDKLALLIKIREATYGPIYNIIAKCTSCGSETKLGLDINKDLIMNSISEELTDPREIQLPLLGKSLKIRMPKVKDEQFLNANSDIYSNLWRFVLDIDGCTNKEVIAEVVKKLPMKDLHLLLAEITGADFGIAPEVLFSCGNCGEGERLEMPITQDFFLGT